MPDHESEEPLHPKRLFSDELMMELGQALVARDVVSRTQVDELDARRALTGETLDRLIINEGMAREEDVLGILSELTHIPFRSMAEIKIDPDAVRMLQPRAALRFKVMPVERTEGLVRLAVSQVPAVATADSLRMLLHLPIDWVLCPDTEVNRAIKHFYGLGLEAVDTLIEQTPKAVEESDGTDVSDGTADAGVIRFVNQIISEAIRMGATDIHIEPFEESLRLRYRIDGILQDIPVPRGIAVLRKSIASCVKIMASINIAERRKPHDGRIKVRCGDDDYDLRVSILPTSYGETVCLRILNRRTMFLELGQIGLPHDQMPVVDYLSSLSHGVILLTGPTGSGKTTTLYALLSRLNKSDVKIITVEDPVEYRIQGINQIQAHAQIGLTFASVLRSILRHDPDIILIGEIRDTETADIAVRASLTGHLVFSTLHTNDAPSAITRLVDMGIEPYLISSCLEGVIAQRLVRVICTRCREPIALDPVILEEIEASFPGRTRDATFARGRGCPECNFTGYKGRIAIFEMMVIDDVIRGLIVHSAPANEIKHVAVERGLITLRRDGWRKVLAGQTTVAEVVRVARKAELPPSAAAAAAAAAAAGNPGGMA